MITPESSSQIEGESEIGVRPGRSQTLIHTLNPIYGDRESEFGSVQFTPNPVYKRESELSSRQGRSGTLIHTLNPIYGDRESEFGSVEFTPNPMYGVHQREGIQNRTPDGISVSFKDVDDGSSVLSAYVVMGSNQNVYETVHCLKKL